MNHYTTEIEAINPLTGLITLWCGPNIPAISFSDAEDYCQRNGLGYCRVTGLLMEEIPTMRDGTADRSKKVSYENLN